MHIYIYLCVINCILYMSICVCICTISCIFQHNSSPIIPRRMIFFTSFDYLLFFIYIIYIFHNFFLH